MPNSAVDWLHSQGTKVVSAGLVTAGYVVWSVFKTALSAPELVALSLLVFVCLIWLSDRFWHLPAKLRVRQWLDESGFDVRTAPLENSEFRYIVTDNVGVKVTVFQVKRDGPIEIVALGIQPTPGQKAAFDGFDPPRREAFWAGVRLELLRLGIQYSALTLEPPGFDVSNRIPFSNQLTDVDFLGAMLRVRSVTRYLLGLLGDFVARETNIPAEPTINTA